MARRVLAASLSLRKRCAISSRSPSRRVEKEHQRPSRRPPRSTLSARDLPGSGDASGLGFRIGCRACGCRSAPAAKVVPALPRKKDTYATTDFAARPRLRPVEHSGVGPIGRRRRLDVEDGGWLVHSVGFWKDLRPLPVRPFRDSCGPALEGDSQDGDECDAERAEGAVRAPACGAHGRVRRRADDSGALGVPALRRRRPDHASLLAQAAELLLVLTPVVNRLESEKVCVTVPPPRGSPRLRPIPLPN